MNEVNALIRKAAAGDSDTFETLMQNYLRILYNFILLRVSSKEDTDDIVQDVMLSVWLNLPSYNYDSSFKTWVLGIANHKINDFFRIKYRKNEEDIDDHIDSLSEDDFAGDSEEKLDLRSAVSELKQSEKELLFMIFNAQLSYSDISYITGVPVGTIKSRMSAVKEKLKEKLGEAYYG